MILTLPIAHILIIAPYFYLSLLFGSSYAAAQTVVVALTIGHMLNLAVGPVTTVLEGSGYSRLILINSFLPGCRECPPRYLPGPRYGIIGTGIGTAEALTIRDTAGLVEINYLKSVHPLNIGLLKVWIAAGILFLTGALVDRAVSDPLVVAPVISGCVTCSHSRLVRHSLRRTWMSFPCSTSTSNIPCLSVWSVRHLSESKFLYREVCKIEYANLSRR